MRNIRKKKSRKILRLRDYAYPSESVKIQTPV